MEQLQSTFILLAALASVIAVGVFFLLLTLYFKAVQKACAVRNECENKYRSLYESMNEGMALHHVTFGNDGAMQSSRISEINPVGAAMFGEKPENIIGRDSQILFGKELERTLSRMTLTAGRAISSTFEMALPGRDTVFSICVFSPRYGIIATLFDDITERCQSKQLIQRMANFDELTNLPNRALLHDRINQAIAQATRDKRQVGILFLDLDHFKKINDTMGHSIGDEFLRTIAQRLSQFVRKSDTLSRLGGDEFVIALTAVNHADDLILMANSILTAISKPLDFEGIELYASVSIGIALYPEDGDSVETLLKHADLAMYKAKDHGRNNFQFFSHDMNEHATERLMLENNLRKAIERDELFLEYQPQLDLQTGILVGVETLVRWQHPLLGLVSPEKFIHLAEEAGLINSIGQWILERACRQAMLWHEAGLPTIRVAVNISARQFAQQNFLESILKVVADVGLPTNWLEIELTESIIMSDIERTATILRTLKDAGISISIDDFGTGYSSLAALKQFPLDSLKIDRSFVSKVHLNADDGAIAEAIIKMSHSLGLNVVAEGIELQEQLTFLSDRGCNVMQGYFFSMPLSPEAVEQFMKEY